MASEGELELEAAAKLPARLYPRSLNDVKSVALQDMKVGWVILVKKVPRFIDMSPELGLTPSRSVAKGYSNMNHPAVVLNVDEKKGGVDVLISTSIPEKGLGDKVKKKDNLKYFVYVKGQNKPEPGQPGRMLQPKNGANKEESCFITYASAFVTGKDDKYTVVNDYSFLKPDNDFLHTELKRVKTEDNNAALDQAAALRKK